MYTHTYTNMFLNFKENTTKFRGKLYRLRLLLLTYPSCTIQHFFKRAGISLIISTTNPVTIIFCKQFLCSPSVKRYGQADPRVPFGLCRPARRTRNRREGQGPHTSGRRRQKSPQRPSPECYWRVSQGVPNLLGAAWHRIKILKVSY